MSKITKVTQVTHNRFLNFYELDTENKNGRKGRYFLASRAEKEEELKIRTKENHPDGVVIYSVYGENHDKVVMIRQYRYPLGDYIYELPAGLVDPGESYHESAVRELKEETGLTLSPVTVDDIYQRPYFTTIGMTDESCATVYGYASGEITGKYLEENEEIQVVLADRKEVERILREENVALICAYHMMHFLHDEDPFAFLK